MSRKHYWLLAIFLAVAACRSHQAEKPRTGPLAERVGNEEGLRAIVDAFAAALLADDRMKPYFAGTDMAAFKDGFTAYLCKTVGAECSYERGMAEVHAGMAITDEHFGVFMELFIVAMNEAELPQQEQNDLIDAMLATQPEVVGK